VVNNVTTIGLFLSRYTVTAGESTVATVVDAAGNIITASSLLSIQGGAGGAWAANVYTSARAGTWTVTAVYGPYTATAPLTVTHAGATALDISPDSATITTAGSQAYTAVATDALGNAWVPAAGEVTWSCSGAGSFAGATYTPDAADAGQTLDIQGSLDGVDSDVAKLTVNTAGGAGLILAWDKDDLNFYLCANPADPAGAGATGLIPAANGTYTVNGVSVTVSGASGNRAVTVNNSSLISNSLRVRWYLRSGAVYTAYAYSSIAGVNKTATYSNLKTYVDGQYKPGFWGLHHSLDAADPTSITYGATQQ